MLRVDVNESKIVARELRLVDQVANNPKPTASRSDLLDHPCIMFNYFFTVDLQSPQLASNVNINYTHVMNR